MKVQVLMICYNSSEYIFNTLKTWEPYVDRFSILINGGPNNDFAEFPKTLEEVQKIKKEVLVFTENFTTFDETRNSLIRQSRCEKYFNIFIDDTYELVHFPSKLQENEYQQINIVCGNLQYMSNRCFNKCKAKYINKIHEIIDTEERFFSGIIVNYRIYKSSLQRTADRQLYDLSLLDGNDSRTLYYRAMTIINLWRKKLRTKEDCIQALEKRLLCPSSDIEETKRACYFLYSFKKYM